MTRTLRAVALALALVSTSACTLTNSAGESVTITKENFLHLVIDKVMAGCAFYNQNATSITLVRKAAIEALDVSEKVDEGADRLKKVASIACALLAPPAAAAESK